MTKHCLYSVRVAKVAGLIVSVIASPLCSVARADASDTHNSFRIRDTAVAPIGRVYSLDRVSINGRITRGENLIWGGDLLQVPEGAIAQVSIDLVGSVKLAHGAKVRLAVSLTGLEGIAENINLIMSLMSGAAVARLAEGATAYIDLGGSVVTASKGSIFRAEVRDGRAEVYIESGSFTRYYFVYMYKYDPTKTSPTQVPLGQRIKVKTRSKKQYLARATTADRTDDNEEHSLKRETMSPILRVGLAGYFGERTIQSDQQPADGRTLKFDLGTPNVGTLVSTSGTGQTVTGITDAKGEALVAFEAGPRKGLTKFSITDVTPVVAADEQRRGWWGEIEVEKGFWGKSRNKLILAAVAGVVTVCIINCRPSSPLHQVPPPSIR